MADLDQNLEPKGRISFMDMFALVCHGTVYNNAMKRPLLGKEHLFVMGLPIFRNDDLFPMPFNTDEVSEYALKHVAGNAMDIMVVTAWTVYMLAHIRPRTPSIPTPMRPGRCEDDDMSHIEFENDFD